MALSTVKLTFTRDLSWQYCDTIITFDYEHPGEVVTEVK